MKSCTHTSKRFKRLSALSPALFGVAIITLAWASPSAAVGISLMEVGASGLGNAYAGSTAEANDPGVMFFNPAALTRFKKAEQVLSAVGIQADTKFVDSAGGSNNYPAGGVSYRRKPSYGIAPSNFFAIPYNDRLVFGAGISGSAGLILRYPNDYPGRLQSKSTDIKVTRINGGFGYKLSPQLSIGANLSVERFFESIRTDVDYANAASTEPGLNGLFGSILTNPLANRAFFDATGNSRSVPLKLKLYGTQYNAQLGMLFEPREGTRMGLSFRPKTHFELEGRYEFQAEHPELLLAVAPELLANGRVTSTIMMPSELRMSFFHRLSPWVDVMADFTRMDYSGVDTITYKRSDGSTLKSYIQQLNAGNRYAIGMNHRVAKRLMMRYGFSLDEATISDQYRVTALPDQSRKNFNIGGRFRASETDFIDVGLQVSLFKDAVIQDRSGLQGMPGEKSYDGDLNGRVKSRIIFFGLQYHGDF